MELLAIAAGLAFLLWISSKLGPRWKGPARPAALAESAPRPTEELDLKVLSVPADLAAAIERAIRGGTDPDAVPLPTQYHAHDLRVVGESFSNPSGSSRQEIIDQSSPGDVAYLAPEPDNPHDPHAVRVYVPGANGVAEQIGYLPRGYEDIVDEVRSGRVAAWLKSKQRADNGLWGATLYLLRREEFV